MICFYDIKVNDNIIIENGLSSAIIKKIYGKSKIKIETKYGWNTICQFSQLENGTLKDRMRPRYYNKGFLGDGKYSTRTIAGCVWRRILYKCFDDEVKDHLICKIDNNWLNFQVFAKWYNTNNIPSWCIDKDLKIPGNKKYSPDTCLVIPTELNSSIKDGYKSKSKLPFGINFNSKGKGLKYWINNEYNNQKSGYFDNLDEAIKFYWDQKYKRLLELSFSFPKFKEYIIKYFEYLFFKNCPKEYQIIAIPFMDYVYIGSPFFSESQLNTVKSIENALDKANINYFSPRSEGILIEMNDIEREQKFKEIYESNIEHMNGASYMIANIDDRDIGTSFEIGFMHASKKPIFSFSGNNHQINIMLRQSVKTHNTNTDNLMRNIQQEINNESLTIFDELTKNVT